jgi:hypothetical protein
VQPLAELHGLSAQLVSVLRNLCPQVGQRVAEFGDVQIREDDEELVAVAGTLPTPSAASIVGSGSWSSVPRYTVMLAQVSACCLPVLEGRTS